MMARVPPPVVLSPDQMLEKTIGRDSKSAAGRRWTGRTMIGEDIDPGSKQD